MNPPNNTSNFGEQFQGFDFSAASQNSQTMQLNTSLNDTMKSFKDQLTFNLQSLNLTLSSLSSSMSNLGTRIGELGTNTAGRYINSGLNQGAFLGNLSQEYVNSQGQLGLSNLALGPSAFLHRPYNIYPMEYYMGASMQQDMFANRKFGSMFVNTVRALTPTTTLSTLFGGGAYAGTVGYSETADMLRRMSGRFGSSPFNLHQAYNASRGIQRLSFGEAMSASTMDNRIGLQGFKDITALGLQGDIFHGQTPEELVNQVKETSKVVKVMASVLGSKDVKDAMDAVIQLKDMGLNMSRSGSYQRLDQMAKQAYGYGASNSMTAGQMFTAGLQIAQSGYGTYGIPGALGVTQGMQNLAYAAELQKRGIFSAADVAAGGGLQSIAAKRLGFDAQMFQSPMGRSAFASGFINGQFDINLANQLTSSGNNFANVIGSGIRNMFGGDGIFVNSARAQVDLNNIIAKALKDNPQALQQLTQNLVQQQLKYSPQYRNADLEGKYYLAAQHLMNQGVDAQTAKMMSAEMHDPSIANRRDYMAAFNKQKGLYEKLRGYNSAGAELYRETVEPLQRFGAGVSQWFTRLGENFTGIIMPHERYASEDFNTASFDSAFIHKNYKIGKDGKRYATGTSTIDYAAALNTLSQIGFSNNNLYDNSELRNSDYYRMHMNNIQNGGTGTFWSKVGSGIPNSIGRIFGGVDWLKQDYAGALALQDTANVNSNIIDKMLNGNTTSQTQMRDTLKRLRKKYGIAIDINGATDTDFLKDLGIDNKDGNLANIGLGVLEKAGFGRIDQSAFFADADKFSNKELENKIMQEWNSFGGVSDEDQLTKFVLNTRSRLGLKGNDASSILKVLYKNNKAGLRHGAFKNKVGSLIAALENPDELDGLSANGVSSKYISQETLQNAKDLSDYGITPADFTSGKYGSARLQKAGHTAKTYSVAKALKEYIKNGGNADISAGSDLTSEQLAEILMKTQGKFLNGIDNVEEIQKELDKLQKAGGGWLGMNNWAQLNEYLEKAGAWHNDTIISGISAPNNFKKESLKSNIISADNFIKGSALYKNSTPEEQQKLDMSARIGSMYLAKTNNINDKINKDIDTFTKYIGDNYKGDGSSSGLASSLIAAIVNKDDVTLNKLINGSGLDRDKLLEYAKGIKDRTIVRDQLSFEDEKTAKSNGKELAKSLVDTTVQHEPTGNALRIVDIYADQSKVEKARTELQEKMKNAEEREKIPKAITNAAEIIVKGKASDGSINLGTTFYTAGN